MSASADRERFRRPPPLRERSQSQNNVHAIRIVPYSPPRLEAQHGRTPSQSSSAAAQPHAAEAGRSGSGNDSQHGIDAESPSAGKRVRAATAGSGGIGGYGGNAREGGAGSPGSALSSAPASTLRLVRTPDEGVSGSKLAIRPTSPASPTLRPSSYATNIAAINAAAAESLPAHQRQQHHHHYDHHDDRLQQALPPLPAQPALSPTSPRPLSRRRNFIAVHADKTFSLVPRRDSGDLVRDSLTSPPLSHSSTVRTSSSHERLSSGLFSSEGRPSSPLTTTASATLPERSPSPFIPSPGSSTVQLAEDLLASSSSPWNYRMVGGLRKVPRTPDLKQKRTAYAAASAQQREDTSLAALPESSSPTVVENDDTPTPTQAPPPPRLVIPQPSKASFTSEQTTSASTSSEKTNYKVYAHSPSPAAQDSFESLEAPSSSHSNIQLLGSPSPAPTPSFESSPLPLPPSSPDSNQNYILHGDPSPSPSLSLATISRRPRPTYSQESLIVPPLQPVRKRSHERFGYYKSRSRESLRHAASIRSIRSIASVIGPEATSIFFAGQAFLDLRGPSVPGVSSHPPDSWASTTQALPSSILASTAGSGSGSGSGSGTTPSSPPLPQQRRVQMVEPHPHQWSSQLSAILSESEGGSTRGGSRSLSMASGAPSGSGNRRSSTGWASSTHSRQMLSISSSIAQQLDDSRSQSRSDSLERPQPTYQRSQGGPSRTVRDQDEHGDGLTDLEEVHQQPSRSGLSAFFASSSSSGRNLHSSGSSRANSLNSGSIPAWARVYYGSGERRFIRSNSMISSASSRPSSGVLRRSGSPDTDRFPLNLYTPRRRAREVQPTGPRPFSDSASMEISELPPAMDYRIQRGVRQKTSSIWSPHLRMDRRASRFSMWEPPSVNWSADSGAFGRRNIQVVAFMVGFIFPFAWMIAAFLPLPTDPRREMEKRKHGEFGVPEAFKRQIGAADEVRYQSAKWWRTLNRVMSIIGLLIIGAIIALVVIGVREGWGQRD